MEHNRIPAMMKEFFRERQASTFMVRPVHNETKLQQVDAMPIEELRSEFQQQLSDVKRIINMVTVWPRCCRASL
ncbi:unnamed protein product [Peronospora farinosa]|uniref:Uncharacterized protein n=1 Tax=Peronospora farinosa TaxID=134698 RepID=A0ABN8CBK4_9STRA|nr:unnamed protein product [Peronospora farinosa]